MLTHIPLPWNTLTHPPSTKHTHRSLGWYVLLDRNDKYIAIISELLLCNQDLKQAEAMACRDALSWIKNMNISQVSLELDCQIVAIPTSKHDFSYTSPIFISATHYWVTFRVLFVVLFRVQWTSWPILLLGTLALSLSTQLQMSSYPTAVYSSFIKLI